MTPSKFHTPQKKNSFTNRSTWSGEPEEAPLLLPGGTGPRWPPWGAYAGTSAGALSFRRPIVSDVKVALETGDAMTNSISEHSA